MRVNFSSGNWVELRDHKSLTARQVRPIVALVTGADKGADTSFQAVDMYVSALVDSTSYGESYEPADMPWSDYVEMVKAIQPQMREALGADNASPDGAGDPDSPTGA